MDEWGDLGPISGNVTLDGSGNGILRFAPAGTRWRLVNVSVKASSAVLEATATLYKGFVGDQYRIEGTSAGSTGDTTQLDNPITLNDGEAFWVVWIGGDPGAVATAVILGQQSVPRRGFRAGV